MSRILGIFSCLIFLTSCSDKAKAETPIEWTNGFYSWTPPENWTNFDFVSLDLENTSSAPFELYIEVRDSKSKDYWNRANLVFTIGPGRQKLNFSTRLYAGESLRPGRALEFWEIKSVILARGENQEGRLIRFYGGELKSGLKASERGIFAFDLGPRASAQMPGFVGITADSTYKAEQKYGWTNVKFWAPYERACWVSGPDSLSEDCLMPYAGSFRVDLADGDYEVAIAYDHPGPFWGEFPTWDNRKILINGKAVVDEEDDAQKSFQRYFRNENTLPLDANEVAESFGPGRVPLRAFSVNVKGSPLEISFLNRGCPDKPCFGLAISSIIVGPKDKMKSFLQELDVMRKTEFAQRSRWSNSSARSAQISPPSSALVASSDDFDHGFWDFVASKDADDLRLEIEAATPEVKNAFSAAWLQPRVRRLDAQASSLGLVEDLVVEGSTLRVRKGTKLRVFAKWSPSALPAGSVHEARLLVKSAKETLASWTLSARVRKKNLDAVPFAIGPFGNRVLERWWPGIDESPRLQALANEGFRLMRASGLNAYTFEPLVTKSGKVFDFFHINNTMKDAKARGFSELVGYGHFLRDEDACRSSMTSAEWATLFSQLESESQKNSWLPLTIVVCDEPEGDEIDRVTKLLSTLPKTSATARVRWSVTTHIDTHSSAAHVKLANTTSLPLLADFEMHRLPTNWIFYNNLSRWNFGFRAWALSKYHGMKGRLAWTWNQNASDPFNPLDSREDDYRWCTSLKSGKLACTASFYEEVVESTLDLRRALTLSRLAETSKSPVALQAKALLEEIKTEADKKEVSHTQISEWSTRAENLLSEAGF